MGENIVWPAFKSSYNYPTQNTCWYILLKLLALLLLLTVSPVALAYIGPGAGISVLGSLLGILGTIVVAIGAIVLWPIRKLIKRRKQAGQSSDNANPGVNE